MILARYSDGYSQAEIGKFYGLSQSAVSLIIRSGKKGVTARPKETRGAKPRLSDADLADLCSLLQSEQSSEDFSGWNKWSIKELISREFGVDYHENYIYELMRKINYTSQLPSRKDYRQSPEKVAHFKTTKVVEIKKKRSKKIGN